VNGLYANLGLLLSDQCTHTVKFAVFGEQGKAITGHVKKLRVRF